MRILSGEERGARRDMVLVNAAAAMLVAGTVESLAAGVARAAETIDAGRAHATLEALKTMSHME